MIEWSVSRSLKFLLQVDKKITKGRNKNTLLWKIVVAVENPRVSVDKLLLNVIFSDSGATKGNQDFSFDFMCKKWLSRRY